MRILALTSLLVLVVPLVPLVPLVCADSPQGSLYPPGLLPLISRANTLLSSGQFSDAAKIYSEAIDQSPADYLLYYKRATAHFSLQRHSAALDDFERVLALTDNTFSNAHLMIARIHMREGQFANAQAALAMYINRKGKPDPDAIELERDIHQAGNARNKAERERHAQLWTACVESTSRALKVASHATQIRTWRAECALASGDVASSVGDLTRLTHILPPSTTLSAHIFRLSYILLPSSPAPLNTLKQCLHYDPDSKVCLALHRMLKAFDRSFNKMEDLIVKEDWRGVVKHILTADGGKTGDLWRKWEAVLEENIGERNNILPLVPPELITTEDSAKSPAIPLPDAKRTSSPRQTLVRALCKAYTHLADNAPSSVDYKVQMSRWCGDLLALEGCANDVDGLTGKAEGLLSQEEWEEAVRTFEQAFEASGKSDRSILQRLQNAQRLLKASRLKDYYKIVGVARDADARTIKKAFRKAAKSAHPDKGGSEAKMAALNEAYEVLSNPDLRARFDAGEDPMDPQAQQGGNPFAHHGFNGGAEGGHPFAHFFQQSGGGSQGGFQFHFGGNR